MGVLCGAIEQWDRFWGHFLKFNLVKCLIIFVMLNKFLPCGGTTIFYLIVLKPYYVLPFSGLKSNGKQFDELYDEINNLQAANRRARID